MNEAPLSDWAALLEGITEAIHPLVDKPFALFGHSLGAIVAFAVARELDRKYEPVPKYLFVSGRAAPRPGTLQQRLFHRPTHTLTDAALLQRLRKLNGTPEELLEDPELMKLVLPRLRADFALSETYVYEGKEPRLKCPITALGGSEDSVNPKDLDAWRHMTEGHFALEMLPGHHFFLHTAQSRLLQVLTRELWKVIEALSLWG